MWTMARQRSVMREHGTTMSRRGVSVDKPRSEEPCRVQKTQRSVSPRHARTKTPRHTATLHRRGSQGDHPMTRVQGCCDSEDCRKIKRSGRKHVHKIRQDWMEQRVESWVRRQKPQSIVLYQLNEEEDKAMKEGWSDKYKKSIDCSNPKDSVSGALSS